MSQNTDYFWVYDPSYYTPKQLKAFGVLLSHNIDITNLEKLRVTLRDLEALIAALNKGFNIKHFIDMPELPTPSVIEYIASMNRPELLKYANASIDLNTMRWVNTWVGTDYENDLATLLRCDLNWAQLTALSDIYHTYVEALRNNTPYINPRALAKHRVDFDTIERIQHIFDTQQIDMIPYVDKFKQALLKDIVYAVYSGVPIVFIDEFAPHLTADILQDAIEIVRIYGKEQLLKITDQLKDMSLDSVSKTLTRCVQLSSIHSKYPLLFKRLDKPFAKRFLRLKSQPKQSVGTL